MSRTLCRLLLLTCLVSIVHASIVIVVPRDSGAVGHQYSAAAQAASEYAVSNGILPASNMGDYNITLIYESNQPVDDLQTIRDLINAGGVRLALFAGTNPTLAFTFGISNVPVGLLSPTTISLRTQAIPNAFQMSQQLQQQFSLVAALKYLNWTSTALVYSPEYVGVVSTYSSALNSRGISVPYTALVDTSFPASAVSSIITSLERGTTRVCTVLAAAAEFELLLNSVRDTVFEFVWVDPAALSAENLLFNQASFYSNTAVGAPKGIISLEANEIVPSPELIARLRQINSTTFESSIPDTFTFLAHDALLVWAHGVHDVQLAAGNVSNATEVTTALLSRTAPRVGMAAGRYSFDRGTGMRSGDISIMNMKRILNTNSTMSRNFTEVGRYTEATTNQPEMIVWNITDTWFASGTSDVPSSNQPPMVTIGLIWATLRDIHRAWIRVVQMALEDINRNGTIVPGHTVRAIFYDNSDSVAMSIQGAAEVINRGAVGILGPVRSSQSIALQYYIGGLRVPAIGHSSTADILSDKLNYPTFFRTVITDSFQAQAIVRFIRSQGWSSYCLLNFNDDYGTGVSNGIFNFGRSQNLTMIARSTFTISSNFNETLQVIKSASCRIIAAVPDANTFTTLMKTAWSMNLFGNKEYVWIFSESIAGDLTTKGITDKGLSVVDFQGSFITRPLDGLLESPSYKSYYDRIRVRAADLGFSTSPPLFGGQLYDAVWCLAISAGQMLQNGSDPLQNRNKYLDYLKAVSFEGITGPVSFDKNQDRVGASYGVYNFLASVGAVVQIGIFTDGVGLRITTPPLFWDNTTVPPVDVVEIPISLVGFRDPGPAILSTFAAIILALLVFVLVAVSVYHSNELIRRSSPYFLIVALVGLFMAVISVFFWFGEPNEPICHFRVWFGFLGAAISYGALLAKNWRLWRLYNEPSLRVLPIKNAQLLGALGGFLTPLIIVLILWSTIQPFQVRFQTNASSSLRYRTCTSSNDRIFAGISFAYMFLAMVIGAVLSFKTRTLPDAFRESQYIALSTYNLLFVSAVGILIGYIMDFEPTVFLYIIPVCILFGALVTGSLLYIPKLWLLFFRRSIIAKTDMSYGFASTAPRKKKPKAAFDVPPSSEGITMSNMAVRGSIIELPTPKSRLEDQDNYDAEENSSQELSDEVPDIPDSPDRHRNDSSSDESDEPAESASFPSSAASSTRRSPAGPNAKPAKSALRQPRDPKDEYKQFPKRVTTVASPELDRPTPTSGSSSSRQKKKQQHEELVEENEGTSSQDEPEPEQRTKMSDRSNRSNRSGRSNKSKEKEKKPKPPRPVIEPLKLPGHPRSSPY